MGYTHYWTVTRNADLDKLIPFLKKGIDLLKEDGIDIVGPTADTDSDAILNDEVIAFNGAEEKGHESFSLRRNCEVRSDFCKTNRKSYDKLVVATILQAKDLGVIASWSSDGDAEDLREGRDLKLQILDELAYPKEGSIENKLERVLTCHSEACVLNGSESIPFHEPRNKFEKFVPKEDGRYLCTSCGSIAVEEFEIVDENGDATLYEPCGKDWVQVYRDKEENMYTQLNICHDCGSEDITYTGEEDFFGIYLWKEVTCKDCNHIWKEEFKFHRIDNGEET